MKNYLITGATGYIGSMLTKYILKSDCEAEISVIVRNREKAKEMLPEEVRVIEADLTDALAMGQLQVDCDYMIHCAAVTQSAAMNSRPVEVTQSIVNVTQNVCELAKRCNVKSMIYLSSMEVYGKIHSVDGCRITEEEVSRGEVELLNSRSCYPLAKRMAENICYSYFKEYGLPVKVARLAQTFGAGILPAENRVFAQFARAAMEGRDIVLHTTGESMGNYCGIRDVLRAMILLLERGENGEAYNVVNEACTMKIREMAEFVATEIAGGKIRVVYDIPEGNQYGYAADTGLLLSGQKLMALGWKPTQSLKEMYQEMLEEKERP